MTKKKQKIIKEIKSIFALLIYDFDKEEDIRKIEKREKELLKTLGEKMKSEKLNKLKEKK
jgi:hypothetical protein